MDHKIGSKTFTKAGPRLDNVWIPRNGGKRYRRFGCGKLNCAHRVDEVTVAEARARGYTACKVRQPRTE